MFKLSTYRWCCWYVRVQRLKNLIKQQTSFLINSCSLPYVRDHEHAVVQHLTSIPPTETAYVPPNKELVRDETLGTEKKPIVIYRNSLRKTEEKRCLRFVCISDTHNRIDRVEIPPGDVFVHCGDAVNHYASRRGLIRFNEFVGQLPHKYKLFVSGNHCVCLDPHRPDESQKLLNNMIYLQDTSIDIDGVSLYGTPWRPKRGCFYRAEAFGYDVNNIRKKKWSKIPENIDILLTHCPPYSIRDFSSSAAESLGCAALLDEVVTRIRPRAHLFGHMHECRGVSLYKSEHNRHLEGDQATKDSNDIVFVNLACHQGATLANPFIIDYYY